MKRWRFARIPTPMLGLAASLVIASTAAAQGTATIRGTVTDSATGQPIENVQVTIPGTTTGTLTDVQGRYTLGNVTAGTLTVRAQVIGYTQGERQITVAAGDTATANFGLRQTAVQLGGVVVVGYGTENRSQVTGAVTTVSGADVANTPVAGVDAALQGKAPGVQVTQNSGDPGNGISVRVRGAASISASNQPLYVVDGVPVQSEDFAQLSPSGQGLTAITGLDPNDIASITVLKDAASAAIYGSRASNGVVMITTKRGQAGKARFTLDAYTGWQNVAHRLSLMNAQQYVAYMNEGADNDGEDEPFTSLTDTTYGYDDWQSAIFRTAPVSNIHLGVSGGTDQLRYFVDGSYFDQDGVVLGSKYNRTNARVNVDYNASNRLSLKTSIGLSHENDNRIEGDNSDNGVVTNAVGEPPIYPYRTATGAFTNPDDFDEFIYTNPVAIGAYDRLPTITDRVLGNVEGNYDFNPHFTLTGRLGADVLHMREDQWQSPLVVGTYAFGASGVAKSGYNNANRYLMESFLTYRGGADSAGSWNIVGGASVEYNHQELNFIRGEGFSSPDFHYVRDAASVVEYDGIPFDHNLVSYFARANYSWQDRYLLSGSIRADGSSRFGPNNRYGVFPAISAGWVISKEPFMGNFEDRFGMLKLRGSFGITGNQSIPNYAYLGTYGSANYGTAPGTSPDQFGNPNLKWESTKEWDAGLDWYPFGGRVSVIADYYHKMTSNLLVQRPIPATTGFTEYWDNIGNVLNRGFELGINTVNIQPSTARGFSWSTDFNISTNHNEVTKLYQNQPIPGTNFRDINHVAVGQPLGEFYVLHFKGVDPQTGDAMFSDTAVNAGNPQPALWGGLGNTIGWKGVQLHAFLQFSQGAKIFNLMRLFADDGGCAWDNKFTYALNRWQHPGDVTNEPRASYDCDSGADQLSDRFIEDGSYIRLQEVTLSWLLPARLISFANLENTKLYVSVHNLHTFTHYSGFDPDVNSNGSSDNIDLGTDYYAYPRARTISVGITSSW